MLQDGNNSGKYQILRLFTPALLVVLNILVGIGLSTLDRMCNELHELNIKVTAHVEDSVSHGWVRRG